MKVSKRDFMAIAILLVIVALVVVSTGRGKAKAVPADDKHRPFYEAMGKGAARTDTEKDCLGCHNPLPTKHPPKEECLICHRLHPGK